MIENTANRNPLPILGGQHFIIQFLILTILWLVFQLIGALLGEAIGAIVFNVSFESVGEFLQDISIAVDQLSNSDDLSDDLVKTKLNELLGNYSSAHVNSLKLAQLVSALLGFSGSALCYVYLTKTKKLEYFKIEMPTKGMVVIVTAMLSFTAIQVISVINSNALDLLLTDEMRLAVDQQSLSYNLQVQIFMTANNKLELLFNLIVIAVIPAVGEELFFRGALQNTLSSVIKNHHVFIFITAFLFSLLHYETSGFVYRLILGMILGYVYYWTSSIWIPILLHLLNNSLGVYAYYIFMNTKTEEIQDGSGTQLLSVLIAGFASFVCLRYLYNYSKENPSSSNEDHILDS